LGSASDPPAELTALPQTPQLYLTGLTSKGREGKETGLAGRGNGGERRVGIGGRERDRREEYREEEGICRANGVTQPKQAG